MRGGSDTAEQGGLHMPTKGICHNRRVCGVWVRGCVGVGGRGGVIKCISERRKARILGQEGMLGQAGMLGHKNEAGVRL